MPYKYSKEIFDNDQRNVIELAILYGAKKNVLDLMTSVNKEEKPIFNYLHMYEFASGVKHALPYEEISIYGKIRNDKPFFEPEEMKAIRTFIMKADKKQVQQIKECVDNNSTYSQLSPLLNEKLSAEKMRVLKSLITIGVDCNRMQIIINENHSYEELKDIKYREQCVNELVLNKYKGSYIPYITIMDMRKIFDKTFFSEETPYYSNKRDRVLGKAFKSKLLPEQIILLCDVAINIDNMESMYNGFLKGISAKEMQSIIDRYKKEEFLIPLNILIEDEIEAKKVMKELGEKDNYKERER